MAAAQAVQFGGSCPSNPFDIFRKHKLNVRPTCGPVAPLTSQPYVLVSGRSSGISTVGQLAAAAKRSRAS